MKKFIMPIGLFVILTVFRYPLNILWVKLLNASANVAGKITIEMSMTSVITSKIVIDIAIISILCIYYSKKAKESFSLKYPNPREYDGPKTYSFSSSEDSYYEKLRSKIGAVITPFIITGVFMVIVDSVTIQSIFELLVK